MVVIISRLRDCSLYCTIWYQIVSSHERTHSSLIGLWIRNDWKIPVYVTISDYCYHWMFGWKSHYFRMWFIFHQQEVSFRTIVLLKHKVKWWKMSSIWILLWFLPLCLLYWNTNRVYLQTQYFNAIQHAILCIWSPVYVSH